MNTAAPISYEACAKVVKALAHPARLLIVHELARVDERCVQDLTDLIGTDMSTVSRHLARLREAGIIEDDRRCSSVYYRLRVSFLRNFLRSVESVLPDPSRLENADRGPTSSQAMGTAADRRSSSQPRSKTMKLIQVLGPGCTKCTRLMENAEAAVQEAGVEAQVEKVSDMNVIMGFGVMMTPALAVDGEVKVVGKVASPEEIKALIV